MLIELGILVLFVLLVAIMYEVIVRVCEPSNLPPGLRISPLLVLFLLRPKELLFVSLTKLGKKFNSVFTMKMGFKNTVIVDKIAVAREALVQKGTDFSGRPRMERERLISHGKSLAFGDYGPAWKSAAQDAHSAARVYGSVRGTLEEKVAEEIKHLTERLEKTKGKPTVFNAWGMQHDPETWENPTQFDPSRFIDSDGKLFYPKDRSFLPFGAGARVCLGESLAKTELILFLSQLVHQFTFSCPEDLPPPDLSPMLGVVIYPKPYKVNINKRD